LKIIDDNRINLDKIHIPIESINKIRSASRFHAIADPFAVVFGETLVNVGITTIGTVGLLSGIDAFFFIPGIPNLVVVLLKNNHLVKKWEYHIEN